MKVVVSSFTRSEAPNHKADSEGWNIAIERLVEDDAEDDSDACDGRGHGNSHPELSER